MTEEENIDDSKIDELKENITSRDNYIIELEQSIKDKDSYISELEQSIKDKDIQIQELHSNIEKKDNQISKLKNKKEISDKTLKYIGIGVLFTWIMVLITVKMIVNLKLKVRKELILTASDAKIREGVMLDNKE